MCQPSSAMASAKPLRSHRARRSTAACASASASARAASVAAFAAAAVRASSPAPTAASATLLSTAPVATSDARMAAISDRSCASRLRLRPAAFMGFEMLKPNSTPSLPRRLLLCLLRLLPRHAAAVVHAALTLIRHAVQLRFTLYYPSLLIPCFLSPAIRLPRPGCCCCCCCICHTRAGEQGEGCAPCAHMSQCKRMCEHAAMARQGRGMWGSEATVLQHAHARARSSERGMQGRCNGLGCKVVHASGSKGGEMQVRCNEINEAGSKPASSWSQPAGEQAQQRPGLPSVTAAACRHQPLQQVGADVARLLPLAAITADSLSTHASPASPFKSPTSASVSTPGHRTPSPPPQPLNISMHHAKRTMASTTLQCNDWGALVNLTQAVGGAGSTAGSTARQHSKAQHATAGSTAHPTVFFSVNCCFRPAESRTAPAAQYLTSPAALTTCTCQTLLAS